MIIEFKKLEDGINKKPSKEQIEIVNLRNVVEKIFNKNKTVLAEAGVKVDRYFNKDDQFISFDLFLERNEENFNKVFGFLESLADERDGITTLTSAGAYNGNIFEIEFQNKKENLGRNQILLYYFEIFANVYKIKNGDYIDFDRYWEEHKVFVNRILKYRDDILNIFDKNARLVRLRFSLGMQPDENKEILKSKIESLEDEIISDLNKIVKLNIKQ